MWNVYFQDQLYGEVSLVGGEAVAAGDRSDELEKMLAHYRGRYSDAELVAGLDRILHGHWFAVPSVEDAGDEGD